jgi:IS5 family transposase
LEITSRVTGQARKFAHVMAGRIKRGYRAALHEARKQLDQMIPRVQQVLRQTRERVLRGNTQAEGKLLSIFEAHTEVIRKGKAHKPNEFGKLVLIQEAENQIITHFQVCELRPADSTLLEGCLEKHVEQFGRAPERVAADPGFFSASKGFGSLFHALSLDRHRQVHPGRVNPLPSNSGADPARLDQSEVQKTAGLSHCFSALASELLA